MSVGTIAGIALLVVIVGGVVWVTMNPTDQQTKPPESAGQQTTPALEEKSPNQGSQEQAATPQENQTKSLSPEDMEQSPVVLSFSMVDGWNAPDWCNGLASVLAKQQVNATVFITGQVAEQHPECVTTFASQGTDVGSQTYRYVNLNVVSDYDYAQEEVRMGKQAVDKAGNIESHAFRAPFGQTNDNLYSLLSSSNITADFSYSTKYGVYDGRQFVEHDLVECECLNSPDRVQQLAGLHIPIIINIDNSTNPGEIESLIVSLKDDGMKFVSASELAGFDMTASTTY